MASGAALTDVCGQLEHLPMAFDISVYRISDRHRVSGPPPDDPDEYDDWVARHDRMLLFEAPLGSGGSVYHYWSAPASRLGLPILATPYETAHTQGVEIEGATLDQLSDELKSWLTNGYAWSTPPRT
jgi:hypothetical protein